jgi:dihydroorotate dehydrogenase (NAD+) catalytic subunit
MAKVAVDAGADALSVINTLTGMAIDIRTRRPKLANRTGGLSGPAIRPVAVRMVYEVYKAVKVPIIGMGGIMHAADAVEFMLAGAAAVAVGTANFINPTATVDVLDGLMAYMREEKIESISDLTGAAHAD